MARLTKCNLQPIGLNCTNQRKVIMWLLVAAKTAASCLIYAKALASLKEEVNDVLIILVILGLADQSAVHDWHKLVRWAKRLREANEKKEAVNGYAE